MASQLKRTAARTFEVTDLDSGELLAIFDDYWTAHCWMHEREESLIDALIEAGELDAESLAELREAEERAAEMTALAEEAEIEAELAIEMAA
jgi:hypothetical protein